VHSARSDDTLVSRRHSVSSGATEQESRAMTHEKEPSPQDVQPTEVEDVEGNSFLVGSTISGDLARVRSREVEREAREHARAKEARQDKAR
jgi:hypothetical protein